MLLVNSRRPWLTSDVIQNSKMADSCHIEFKKSSQLFATNLRRRQMLIRPLTNNRKCLCSAFTRHKTANINVKALSLNCIVRSMVDITRIKQQKVWVLVRNDNVGLTLQLTQAHVNIRILRLRDFLSL